jgi:DnaJ family protein A protein 5
MEEENFEINEKDENDDEDSFSKIKKLSFVPKKQHSSKKRDAILKMMEGKDKYLKRNQIVKERLKEMKINEKIEKKMLEKKLHEKLIEEERLKDSKPSTIMSSNSQSSQPLPTVVHSGRAIDPTYETMNELKDNVNYLSYIIHDKLFKKKKNVHKQNRFSKHHKSHRSFEKDSSQSDVSSSSEEEESDEIEEDESDEEDEEDIQDRKSSKKMKKQKGLESKTLNKKKNKKGNGHLAYEQPMTMEDPSETERRNQFEYLRQLKELNAKQAAEAQYFSQYQSEPLPLKKIMFH